MKTGKHWTESELEQVFIEALRILRTGWEGPMVKCWTQAQMVLPSDRRYDKFSNSFPTQLTHKFKEWRKAQPGPHPELKKLPAQKQRKAGKKLLSKKERSKIARNALLKRWPTKRAADTTQTTALNFCPACGTDVSAITPKNFYPGCGFNLRTIKFV
jgi:hypothetical protein